MLEVFEEQWKALISSGVFSEEASLRLADGKAVTLRGIYYSGTYGEDASAPYAPRRGIRQHWFQVSEKSTAEAGISEWKSLINASVSLSGRPPYRVTEVKGPGSGMLTMRLKESEE